jgi:hypothetical protein
MKRCLAETLFLTLLTIVVSVWSLCHGMRWCFMLVLVLLVLVLVLVLLVLVLVLHAGAGAACWCWCCMLVLLVLVLLVLHAAAAAAAAGNAIYNGRDRRFKTILRRVEEMYSKSSKPTTLTSVDQGHYKKFSSYG